MKGITKKDLKNWIVDSLSGQTLVPEEVALYHSMIVTFFNNEEIPEISGVVNCHLPKKK